MWGGHVSLWYCKEENAPKDAEVSNTQCFSLICFLLNITELGTYHTKNQTFGFYARLWVITCWDQSSKHPSLDTQASCATCKQDKTHFHSLLTGGNVASNREGVAFIIHGPDTDEVLGKGGQRPQDGGCCSARNLNLQKRRRRS